MQAAGDTLAEDVQELFGDVEDYLEGLQTENLSAKARVRKDEILSSIKELKERYHWGFLPEEDIAANFYPAQNGSDDSQTRSFTPSIASEVLVASNNTEYVSENADEPFMALAAISPMTRETFQETENNSQKSTQDQTIILKQGYLEKRSRDPKIFGSEWQKRWCVLDNLTFYYYANEKSKQPKGMFAIENCRAQLALHLRKDSRRNCCFELICPGKRTYEFTAANPGEAMDWVDQIRFLLKDMKSFVIPFEEEGEHSQDKEEAYDDIDSFGSPNVTFHQDTSLGLEEEEAKEESDDCIYEILPDEELDFPPPFDEEDAENTEKTEGFWRSYANYYQGLWDCTGGHPDELSFQRGDLIYIISKEYNMYGWWVGVMNSTVGIVPKDYLMPAYEVEER